MLTLESREVGIYEDLMFQGMSYKAGGADMRTENTRKVPF